MHKKVRAIEERVSISCDNYLHILTIVYRYLLTYKKHHLFHASLKNSQASAAVHPDCQQPTITHQVFPIKPTALVLILLSWIRYALHILLSGIMGVS